MQKLIKTLDFQELKKNSSAILDCIYHEDSQVEYENLSNLQNSSQNHYNEDVLPNTDQQQKCAQNTDILQPSTDNRQESRPNDQNEENLDCEPQILHDDNLTQEQINELVRVVNQNKLQHEFQQICSQNRDLDASSILNELKQDSKPKNVNLYIKRLILQIQELKLQVIIEHSNCVVEKEQKEQLESKNKILQSEKEKQNKTLQQTIDKQNQQILKQQLENNNMKQQLTDLKSKLMDQSQLQQEILNLQSQKIVKEQEYNRLKMDLISENGQLSKTIDKIKQENKDNKVRFMQKQEVFEQKICDLEEELQQDRNMQQKDDKSQYSNVVQCNALPQLANQTAEAKIHVDYLQNQVITSKTMTSQSQIFTIDKAVQKNQQKISLSEQNATESQLTPPRMTMEEAKRVMSQKHSVYKLPNQYVNGGYPSQNDVLDNK